MPQTDVNDVALSLLLAKAGRRHPAVAAPRNVLRTFGVLKEFFSCAFCESDSRRTHSRDIRFRFRPDFRDIRFRF